MGGASSAKTINLPPGFSMGDNAKGNENPMSIDGSWIILQNWSECTLKCGGGQSYQHRMCVPPQNGGKPCVGSAILIKPCNTQSCPDTSSNESANIKLLNPIIRVVPISNRFQRFQQCIIKEGDLQLQMKL